MTKPKAPAQPGRGPDPRIAPALMVKAGMSPADAITAATAGAAELIGDARNIGSIQAGRYADIIAVAGDPLADVTTLEKVGFVMKGGTVYKADGKAVAP